MSGFSKLVAVACLGGAVATGASAQTVSVDRETFIRQTHLTVFYHASGHGLIDLLDLPLYGPNERSADIESVMSVDFPYDEDRGIGMMTNAANLFAAEGIDRGEDQLAEFVDAHGSDQGRFYNTICVHHGGNTEGRQAMADEMGLPEARAERCEDEYQAAANGRGVVIAEMAAMSGGETLVLTAADENAPITIEVMEGEIIELNRDLGLEMTVPIAIEACGDPNAFCSSDTESITMCTEFDEYLGQMHDFLAAADWHAGKAPGALGSGGYPWSRGGGGRWPVS